MMPGFDCSNRRLHSILERWARLVALGWVGDSPFCGLEGCGLGRFCYCQLLSLLVLHGVPASTAVCLCNHRFLALGW